MSPTTPFRNSNANLFGYVRIDTNLLHNWSLTAIAQRVTLLAALSLVGIVAIPTFTAGQDYMPRSQAEYEFRDLHDKNAEVLRQMGKFDEVLPRLAVMQVQVNALLIGQQKQEDWQAEEIKGMLAVAGAIGLLVLSKIASSMGITFNRKQDNGHEENQIQL